MPVTLMLFVKILQLHISALVKQALKGTGNTVKVTAPFLFSLTDSGLDLQSGKTHFFNHCSNTKHSMQLSIQIVCFWSNVDFFYY